jgi:hypothetical protein
MSDITDLHGVFPTPLRWNAEAGVLGYGVYDEATGERDVKEIELASPQAKFVMDLDTRERGYGLIRTGLYDMRLTPVGSAPPQWPGDDDFKPAVACWLWNPPLGELRLETNGAMFRTAVSAVWDRCRTFTEAAQGLQPVIHFADRQERLIRAIGKTFWAPVINIIGWVPRDKVPPFALRPPTVKPPIAIDSQVRHALLQHVQQKEPVRAQGKAKSSAVTQGVLRASHHKSEVFGPRQAALEDFLDDRLPDDPVPEL